MKYYLLALETFFVLLITSACSVNPLASNTPTETLATGTGRVSGVLQVTANGGAQPAQKVVLYLAETIKDSAGKDSVAALDRVNSPRTETDNQGRFVFKNVPPGNYGLILDVISNSYLLMKPGTQEALLIKVSEGQQVDLGTLLYETLPISAEPQPWSMSFRWKFHN
jgi:hypothetical protein